MNNGGNVKWQCFQLTNYFQLIFCKSEKYKITFRICLVEIVVENRDLCMQWDSITVEAA